MLNFQGRVKVQATIATDPGDDDWYSVLPDTVPYIEYPRPEYLTSPWQMGETSTIGFNFLNNAVWLRAIVDRDYLLSPEDSPLVIMRYGTVSYIMVNYCAAR